MVKTTSHSSLLLVAACSLAMGGCGARGPFVSVRPESLELSRGPAAPFLSLAAAPGSLYCVFADRATTTLDLVQLPDTPHLPPSAPAAEVIDKVDVVAPLSPTFGEHVLAVAGSRAAVLYQDRESDVKNVLKLATRTFGEKQWTLDILEPPGDPLDLEPAAPGGFDAAWSPGLLSYRPAAGPARDAAAPLPFKLQGRPSADGSGGFTAFDSLTSQLLSMRWTGTGFSTQVVPGGSPVQSSLRSAVGRLRVLSWDAKARRLLLHQESARAGSFSTSTVTVCDGTGAVALLPGQSDSTFLIVFDEVRSVGAGRTISQVSLIAPGSLMGARGTRYRKAVLASGEAGIDGFAAARTTDALYVLVSQGNVKLLRIPLAP